MSYSIRLPDGTLVENIPDELDPKEAKQQILAKRPELSGIKPKGGFIPAVKAGFAGLKGDVAGVLGRTGAIDAADAEAYQQEQDDYAKRTFKPSDKGWSEAPWEKLKETAGGSVPYMAAPLAAAATATVAGAPALASMGVAGLASMGQFTGSNLKRQQEQGARLADTNLQDAALAAVPQAALDMVGLKMIPGIRLLFKEAGKEITEEAARKLATQTLRQKAAEYTAKTGKAMGVEGTTEAAQQVFERLQAGLKLNSSDAWNEYKENFIGGAALGGALAPAGHYVERGRQQTEAAVMEGQKAAAAQEEAAKVAAEQEQVEAADHQRKLADPEYHKFVAEDYAKAEAKRRELQARAKVGKNATMADKLQAEEAAAELKEYEQNELREKAAAYLEVKPFLDKAAAEAKAKANAEAAAQAVPEQPPAEGETDMFGAIVPPTTPEMGLDGKPLQRAPSEENAVPSVEDIQKQKDKLTAEQAHWTDEVERRREAMGANPEDPFVTREGIAKFREAQAMLNEAETALKELPPLPKPLQADALNKAYEKAKRDYTVAVEERDDVKMERALNQIDKYQRMQPDLLTKENTTNVQAKDDALANEMAAGRERQQAETTKKDTAVQTDTGALARMAARSAKAREDAWVLQEGHRVRPADMDTSKTVQGSLVAGADTAPRITQEPGTQVRTTNGEMNFTRVLRDLTRQSIALKQRLDVARVRKDFPTQRDLTEQLQAVHEAIIQTKKGGNEGHGGFYSHHLKEQLGTALPPMEVQMDEAQGQRNTAIAAYDPAKPLTNLRPLHKAVDNEISILTGTPLTQAERKPLFKQLGAMLQELGPELSQMGGTRRVNEAVTAIRNSIINKRPGATVREEGAKGRVQDTVTDTPETASSQVVHDELARALDQAPAEARPLLERIAESFQALANSRTEGLDDVAELLHTLRTQGRVDPTVAGDITARMDALEGGGRSETQMEKNPKTGELEIRKAAQQGFDLEPTQEQTVAGKPLNTDTQGPTQPLTDQGKLATAYKTPALFERWLASDALHKIRQMLTNGTAKQTIARAKRRIGALEKTKVELEESIANHKALEAAYTRTGNANVAKVEQELVYAERKVKDLQTRLALELEPFDAELKSIQASWAFEAKVSDEISQQIEANVDAAMIQPAREALAKAREKAPTKANWDAMRPLQHALLEATRRWTAQTAHEAPLVGEYARRNLRLQQELADQNDAIVELYNRRGEVETALEDAKQAQSKRVLAKRDVPAAQRAATVAAESVRSTKKGLADTLSRVRTQRAALEVKLRTVLATLQEELGVPKKPLMARPERTEAQIKRDDEAVALQTARERLATVGGERITHDRYRKTITMLEEAPGRIRELQAKIDDTTLGKTAHDEWVRKLDAFKALTLAASKMLSSEPEARAAAFTRLEALADTARQRVAAAEESKAQDKAKTVAERKAELRKIEQTINAVASVSADRTPVGDRMWARSIDENGDDVFKAVERPADDTAEFHELDRMALLEAEGTSGRLPTRVAGPLVKNATNAPVLKTGDSATAGEGRPSIRNRITQSGTRKSITGKQAVEAGNASTEVTRIEDALEKIEINANLVADKLEAAIESENEAAIDKYTAFAARLESAKEIYEAKLEAAVANVKKGAEKLARVRTADMVPAEKQQVLKPTYTPSPRTKLVKAELAREDSRLERTRIKADLTKAVFRTTETDGAGMHADEVTRLKDRIVKDWTNVPEIEVVATEADLPGHVREQMAKDGVEGKIPGLMDTKSGKVYLVAENLHTGNDVALTIAHEIAGHHGLRTMLGDKYAETMRRLYEGNASIRGAADKRMANNKGMEQGIAVEEALAEMAENPGANVSALARVFHAIKQWFAQKLGIKHVSDAEVRQIVANARQHVMSGTPGGPRGGGEKAVYRTATSDFSDSVIAKPVPFKKRLLENFGAKFEMKYVDMRAPLIKTLKAAGGAAAQNASYLIRKADARMSHAFAAMTNGALGLRKDAKGLMVIEAGHSKSAVDVYKAVGKVKGTDTNDKMVKAQLYLTAIRAANVGWDKLGFDATRVAALKQQADAFMREVKADPAQEAALKNVAAVYGDLNRGLIQFMADTGALPKAKAAALLKHNDYVPFYRVMKDGSAVLDLGEGNIYPMGNIRTQPYLQALEGGDQKLLPLDEAIGRNVMMLTDMAMRNLATKDAAYVLQSLGKGKGPIGRDGKPTNKMQIRHGDGPPSGHVLRFFHEPDPKIKGDEGHRYLLLDTEGTAAEGVPTDMLAHSLEGSFAVVPDGLKVAGWFSDVLRSGITRNPAYVARQLIRDPMAAAFTGGMDSGVVSSVFKSMAEFGGQVAGTSKTGADLMRKGLIHSNIFTGDTDDMAKMGRMLVQGEQSAYDRLLSALDSTAMKADGATRATMYDSAIRQGLSEQEAEMAAMEMMNFNKRGLSPTVQHASRMIPFFNAQIQGMNVLYKAATGNMPQQERLRIKEKFQERAMMMVAGTLIYAAAMDDDETYKNAKARDRYNNWIIPNPVGEEHLKIPIPFEVGILFKMLPEALIDVIKGDFGEPEWQAVKQALIQQVPGSGSMMVISQAVKPIIEVTANHSFFTGRELNPVSKAGLDPSQRFTAGTAEWAKAMSKLLESSPAAGLHLTPPDLENLARGYFGSIPAAVGQLTNSIFSQAEHAKTEPESRASDTPLMGVFFQKKEGGRAVDLAYANARAINQAKATYDALIKQGNRAEAQAYRENVLNVLASPAVAKNYSTTMTALKQREVYLRENTADPVELRGKLNELDAKRRKAADMMNAAVDVVPH